MFSVLLSVYKDESLDHLNEAFVSIWSSQTLRPGQIIIVKDGPLTKELDDELLRWVDTLGNVLTIIEFPVNRGLGAALNVGLEACKFELVARMDTDDIALSTRFEDQVNFLTANVDVDVLGSYVEEMSYIGTTIGIRNVPGSHESLMSSLWACPMIHPTIMMRRSRVLMAGNYNPTLRRRQDYELWFRCAEKGLRFHNLAKPLLRYRFGAYTHKKQSSKMAFQQGIIGYRGARRLGMPLVQRMACFTPFVRSLLPSSVQHYVYKMLKPFDPRQQVK
jgi:glycosyltransferase involved in cell wall biosynthesis